jgi:hypothetical protein
MADETSLSLDDVEVSAPIDPDFIQFDNDPSDPVTKVCSTIGSHTHCT